MVAWVRTFEEASRDFPVSGVDQRFCNGEALRQTETGQGKSARWFGVFIAQDKSDSLCLGRVDPVLSVQELVDTPFSVPHGVVVADLVKGANKQGMGSGADETRQPKGQAG